MAPLGGLQGNDLCIGWLMHFRNRAPPMARQNRRDDFDPNEVGCFHSVQGNSTWVAPLGGVTFQRPLARQLLKRQRI